MPTIYTMVNETDYGLTTKTTGASQAQAWDYASSLGGQSGDVKYTVVNQNVIRTERTFGALGGTITDVRLRYYLDTTNLTLGTTDSFCHLALRTSSSASPVNMHFRNNSGTPQILFQTLKDGGVFNANSFVDLALGKHWIEVWVTRATTNSAADATARLYIDTLSSAAATHASYDIFDDFALIDTLWFGALVTIGPLDAGTSGTFHLGKISVTNAATTIGPFAVGRTNDNIAAIRNRQMHTNLRRGMTTGRRK